MVVTTVYTQGVFTLASYQCPEPAICIIVVVVVMVTIIIWQCYRSNLVLPAFYTTALPPSHILGPKHGISFGLYNK